jgi:hypothetical protein
MQTSWWALSPQSRPVDELGRVALFHLRRQPITARWKLRPGAMEQSGPDLLVMCIDCDKPRLVSVQVTPIRFGPSDKSDPVARALMQHLESQLREAQP